MPADPAASPSPIVEWWTRDEQWWGQINAHANAHAVTSIAPTVAAKILELRRGVLRDGRRDLNASLIDDDAPTTCHLAATDGPTGRIVGCVSLVARPAESLPLQLSLMAVAAVHQGRGIGADLIRCAQQLVATAADPYAAGIWANARDSALGFYERLGFSVVGDGFISSMDLPHHRVRWVAQQKF